MALSSAPAEVNVIHDPQSEAFFASGRNASGQKITVQGGNSPKELFFKEDYQGYSFLEYPDIFFRVALLTKDEINKITVSCNISDAEIGVLQPFIESAKKEWFAESEFSDALKQYPGIQRFIDRFLYVEQVKNATQKHIEYQKAITAWGHDQVVSTLHTLGRKNGNPKQVGRVAVHVYQEFLGNHSQTIRSVLLAGCVFKNGIDELNFLSSLRGKSLVDLETSSDENTKIFLLNIREHKSALVQLYKAYVEGAVMGYVPDTQDAFSDDLPYPGLFFNQNIFLASDVSGIMLFKLMDFGDLKSDVLTVASMQKLREVMDAQRQAGQLVLEKRAGSDTSMVEANFSFSEWYRSALKHELMDSLSTQRPHFGQIDPLLTQREIELYERVQFDESHQPIPSDYLTQYIDFIADVVEKQVVASRSSFTSLHPTNKVSEDIFFVAKLLGISDFGI